MKNYYTQSLVLGISFSIGILVSVAVITISKLLAGVLLIGAVLLSVSLVIVVNVISKLIKTRSIRIRSKLIKKAFKIAEKNKYYHIADRAEAKAIFIINTLKQFAKYKKFFTNTTITSYINLLREQYYNDNELYILLKNYTDKYGNTSEQVIELNQEIWDYNHFTNAINYLALFPEKLDESRP